MENNSKEILSPKNDYVFKLIFADENNKEILAAFLSAVLNVTVDEFQGLEIINSELLKEFKEDKKGILDVRVKTKSGKQIDIEIQILVNETMAERTLFYWSKMYTGQIKQGDDYESLKKCVTINIIDYEFIKIPKAHTVFYVSEDKTAYKLTDVLEIHFLELPKLKNKDVKMEDDEAVVEWMRFIGAESEGVMKMLAEKNEGIKKAYDVLKTVSNDEKTRMRYDARQAEIMDKSSMLKQALRKGELKGELKGEKKGKIEGKIEVARNLLLANVNVEIISSATGLTREEIEKLRQEQH